MKDTDDDDSAVRRMIEELAFAIGSMNLDSVMSFYAPDVVSFDVEPPLQHAASSKRKNWAGVFAMYAPPLDYEFRDLIVVAGDHIAFARSLNRMSGVTKDGARNEHWVRFTMGLRRTEGRFYDESAASTSGILSDSLRVSHCGDRCFRRGH